MTVLRQQAHSHASGYIEIGVDAVPERVFDRAFATWVGEQLEGVTVEGVLMFGRRGSPSFGRR